MSIYIYLKHRLLKALTVITPYILRRFSEHFCPVSWTWFERTRRYGSSLQAPNGVGNLYFLLCLYYSTQSPERQPQALYNPASPMAIATALTISCGLFATRTVHAK